MLYKKMKGFLKGNEPSLTVYRSSQLIRASWIFNNDIYIGQCIKYHRQLCKQAGVPR